MACRPPGNNAEQNDIVDVNISTRAVVGETVNGVKISKVRILVADNSTGYIVYNEFKDSNDNGNLEIVQPYFRIKLKGGSYTAFVVVNEPVTMSPELEKAPLSVSDIREIKYNKTQFEQEKDNVLFSSQRFLLRVNPSSPDYGEVNTNDGAGWKSQLSIDVRRAFVKFSLYLRRQSNVTTISFPESAVKLCNIPTQSYLVDGKYNSTDPQLQDFVMANPIIDDIPINNGNKDAIENYKIVDSIVFNERLFESTTTNPRSRLQFEIQRNGVQNGYDIDLWNKDSANLERGVHYQLLGTITANEIIFTVSVKEWENWDWEGVPGGGNGLINGSIQEPTASTLNDFIYDRETIYLLGLLERSLTWDWSDASKYTFANINTMTLDFSGVKLNNNNVTVIVSNGFTINGSAYTTGTVTNNKITISRKTPKLFEPTKNQLNTVRSDSVITLQGAVNGSPAWDWSDPEYTLNSLNRGQSFKLDFSTVTFNSNITLKLPPNVTASGTGVSGDNSPYTISSACVVTITDNRAELVASPNQSLLDAVPTGRIVTVRNGLVPPETKWDWSGYSLYAIAPGGDFKLKFESVDFGSNSIEIKLPYGFFATGSGGTKVNPYTVSANETVTITSSRIVPITVREAEELLKNGIHQFYGYTAGNPSWVLLSAKLSKLSSVRGDYVNFDFSNVNFENSSTSVSITLPYGFIGEGSGVNKNRNVATIRQQANVKIINNRITVQNNINSDFNPDGAIVPGVAADKPGYNVWGWWSGLDKGSSFTMSLAKLDLFADLYIYHPVGYQVSDRIGVDNSTLGLSIIKANSTGSITFGNEIIIEPTQAQINALSSGVAVTPSGKFVVGAEAWNWSGYAFTSLAAGNSCALNLSSFRFTDVSTSKITITLPNHIEASVGGVKQPNPVVITAPTLVNLKSTSAPVVQPSETTLNAVVNNGSITVTGGTLLTNETWDWSNVAFTALAGNGNKFNLNFSGVNFNSKTITLKLPAGCSVSGKTAGTGNTYTITGNAMIIDSSYPLPADGMITDKITTIGDGQTLVLSGKYINYVHFGAAVLAITSSGQKFYIDMTRLNKDYIFILRWGGVGFTNYTFTVSGGGTATVNHNENVSVALSPRVGIVTITRN